MRLVSLALLAVTASARIALALPAEPPRPSFLRQFAETHRFLAGRPVQPEITPDNRAVLFLRSPPRGLEQSLFSFEVESARTTELLTPAKLLAGAAEQLSTAERARLERMRIGARGFTSFVLSKDGARVLVPLSGRLYLVHRATGRVTPLATGSGAAIDPQLSPDGTQVAYVRGHDVQVLDLAVNRERQVTRGGSEQRTHGLAEFVAQEEMGRFSGFWWSPDGRALAYQEADHSGVERLTIADPVDPTRAAEAFPYPRPGKANVRSRLGVISVKGGGTTWVKWDQQKYPYLATVVWPAKGPLTVLVQNRRQTEQLLLAVDARTGTTRALLTETDPAWLNLDQSFPHWLEDGSGFFWLTERNGGPEIELRSADGTLAASWVPPTAGFHSWVGFDERRRLLYFAGGADPTQVRLYRVREGAAPERVATDLAGPASEWGELSKDGGLLVVGSTSLKQMPRIEVRRVQEPTGKLGELPSVAEEPTLSLVVEQRRVAGPGEGFHALVFRPHTHRPGARLPVLLEVYGGPGHQQVVQGLRPHLLSQWLADQGFAVVKIDGRGTPRRGRAWERAIKGDFGEVPLADQVAALTALARELPELDLARTGVWGWSFGGYLAALAALRQPGLFRTAVAGAPVVDWADYDTHYTERYLGLPEENAEGYRQSSLLTYAAGLKGSLLLVHGTADDNVYFFHSLKLSDALFRAGKPHQLLPLSNFTHMVPDPLVTERLYERIARHFAQSLQGTSAF